MSILHVAGRRRRDREVGADEIIREVINQPAAVEVPTLIKIEGHFHTFRGANTTCFLVPEFYVPFQPGTTNMAHYARVGHAMLTGFGLHKFNGVMYLTATDGTTFCHVEFAGDGSEVGEPQSCEVGA